MAKVKYTNREEGESLKEYTFEDGVWYCGDKKMGEGVLINKTDSYELQRDAVEDKTFSPELFLTGHLAAGPGQIFCVIDSESSASGYSIKAFSKRIYPEGSLEKKAKEGTSSMLVEK